MKTRISHPALMVLALGSSSACGPSDGTEVVTDLEQAAAARETRVRFAVIGDRIFEETIPVFYGHSQWDLRSGWHEVEDANEKPGSGTITGLDKIVDAHGRLHELLFRGGRIFYRTSQVDAVARPAYADIGAQADLPGSGAVTTFGSALTYDNKITQYFWRESGAFSRAVDPGDVPSIVKPHCAVSSVYGCWGSNPGPGKPATDGTPHARLVQQGLDSGQPVSSSWGRDEGGQSMFQAFAIERFSDGEVVNRWRRIPLLANGQPDYECHARVPNSCPWNVAMPLPIPGDLAGQADYTRATWRRPEISLRTYIPCATAWAPLPQSDRYFNGGDKAVLRVHVEAGTAGLETAEKKFGETRSYTSAEPGPNDWCGGAPTSEPVCTTTQVVTPETIHAAVANYGVDGEGVGWTTVQLDVSGENPCSPALLTPPFDGHIFVAVSTDGRYVANGLHDGFPAWELRVDGTLLYAHDPLATGDTPLELFGDMERGFERTGGY